MPDIIPQTIQNKARIDKFILIYDIPQMLKDNNSDSVRSNILTNRDKLQFSLIGLQIPKHTIAPIGIPYMGQTMHVTSQTRSESPEITVNFTIDNNFDNYWVIWKVLAIMNGPRTGHMDPHFAEWGKSTKHSEPAIKSQKTTLPPVQWIEKKMENSYFDYQTNISVIGLREYNEKIIQFNYYNAFPTSLGEINYDYRESNEISCNFTFSYGQMDIKLLDTVS